MDENQADSLVLGRIEEAFLAYASKMESPKFSTKTLPLFLYKYRSCSDYSLSLFKNSKARFTNATQFDDPLDSAIPTLDPMPLLQTREQVECLLWRYAIVLIARTLWRGDASKDEKRAEFTRYLLENVPDQDAITSQAILAYLSSELGAKSDRFFLLVCNLFQKLRSNSDATKLISNYQKVLDGYGEFVQKGLLVYSLSETPTNQLMWTYYAEQDKGFCIRYSTQSPVNQSRLQHSFLAPIFYRDRKPLDPTHYFLDCEFVEGNWGKPAIYEKLFGLSFFQAVFSKETCWRDEKEWRLFLADKNASPFKEEESLIPDALILGISISDKDKEFLLNEAKIMGYHVFQRKLDHTKMSIILENVC